MAIIVAGKLQLKQGSRDEFIQKSCEAIALARGLDSCEHFSVSADPIDENRVNVYEKWNTKASLDSFRNTGSDTDLSSFVDSFDIHEYEVKT